MDNILNANSFDHSLTNFTRYTSDSIAPVSKFPRNENLLIKGDNLPVLQALNKVFIGKVQLIYIDPPYNTGKTNLGYNDRFSHSEWLAFMRERLEIAKDLLSPTGVMFISIDVHEHAHLKVLCDEIFDRSNFVGEIIWENSSDNNATQISMQHEYVICYAKDKRKQGPWKIKSEKAQIIQRKYEELYAIYTSDTDAIEKALRKWIYSLKKSNEIDISGVAHYCYVDAKGVFCPGNSANTRLGGYTFDVYHPVTKRICSKPANGYRWPAKTFWSAANKGDVLWGADETSIPRIKKRISTATELLKGYFYEDNRRSTKALTKLMGSNVFNHPKSINLLKKIIRFTTSDNDIVLDFFAGSGSTAEALLQVNKEEGTKRQFILCEGLDYIETVTAVRIKTCLDGGSFIYCENSSNKVYPNE